MAALRPSIAQYLAELARRGASRHTLRNYGSDLEQFADYFEPPGVTAPEVEQIDLPLLREWLSSLYDRGLAAASRAAKAGRPCGRCSNSYWRKESFTRTLRQRLRTPRSPAEVAGRDERPIRRT